jgi:hypothetical protein
MFTTTKTKRIYISLHIAVTLFVRTPYKYANNSHELKCLVSCVVLSLPYQKRDGLHLF